MVAAGLEGLDDYGIGKFYASRVTDCAFLLDSGHYEHPRVKWTIERVQGGSLLELGCGNGGMTRLLAPRVERLVALDVSTPSLDAVRSLGLGNVETVETLIEHYQPTTGFDWIVMSEVLEHLRRPADVIAGCRSWLVPGGKLLVTTPNGHWESNEHLQEFTLASFAALFAPAGFESVLVSYLRDREERRRWLVAEAAAPLKPPAPDDFNCRSTIRRQRQGK